MHLHPHFPQYRRALGRTRALPMPRMNILHHRSENQHICELTLWPDRPRSASKASKYLITAWLATAAPVDVLKFFSRHLGNHCVKPEARLGSVQLRDTSRMFYNKKLRTSDTVLRVCLDGQWTLGLRRRFKHTNNGLRDSCRSRSVGIAEKHTINSARLLV